MSPSITQNDWSRLARLYGEVCAEALVWKRIAEERQAELDALRQQIVDAETPAEEGGG